MIPKEFPEGAKGQGPDVEAQKGGLVVARYSDAGVAPAGGGTDELVRLYLNEIGRHPLLTRAEEQRLGLTCLRGREAGETLSRERDRLGPAECRRLEAAVAEGEKASEQFVQSNLRLVVSVAKKYAQVPGLSLLDLVQEGNVGLMHAVERFDVRRGFRFSTYGTWWIRQAISRAIANSGRTIRLPVQAGALVGRIRKAQAAFEGEHGHWPSLDELAGETGLPAGKVADAMTFPSEMLSMSLQPNPDSEGELGDAIADTEATTPFEAVAAGLLPQQVQRLLDVLTDRERRVVCLRYGLDRGLSRTLDEVGRLFSLSREQIRQIERRALLKLREHSERVGARELLAG